MKRLSLGLQKYYQRHLFFPNEKKLRDLVISCLKGTNILDAGCGNGWLSVSAWEEGFNVHSFDVAESEVRESLFLSKIRNANIRLTKASILCLPFAKSSFDSVMCINVLEHISDAQQAIHEMKRVLRREGRLIIVVPNGLTFGLLYDRFIHRLISPKKMISRAHKVTFSLADDEISLLRLDKKERIGHNQRFDLTSIRRLLTEHGFKMVSVVNCRFLSPYLRSFTALLGREPLTAFENLDNRMADHIPSNLASEWMIVSEKLRQ